MGLADLNAMKVSPRMVQNMEYGQDGRVRGGGAEFGVAGCDGEGDGR